MRHLQLRNNMYHYRRRTPQALKAVIGQNLISKALHHNYDKAVDMARLIDDEIDNMKHLYRMKLGLGISLVIHKEEVAVATEHNIKQQTISFTQMGEEYLSTLSVTDSKLREYNKMFTTLEGIITTISFTELDKLRNTIKNLPKRNIHKYRVMSLSELLQAKVDEEDKISISSANEYLKILNAILIFAYQRDYLEKDFKVKLFTKGTSARAERNTLSKVTIKQLISSAKSYALAQSYKLLYLSGMRLSEAYKCSLKTVKGVECFDLRECKELKTPSSRRLIPVHPKLNASEALKAIRSLQPNFISKQASKVLTGAKESLYSLRHSFATDLVGMQVNENLVSELMGHAHKTMTLSRYVKGYDVEILYNAIEKLEL